MKYYRTHVLVSVDPENVNPKTAQVQSALQAELLKQGKISLDDLSDEELDKLIEHTFLEDWIDNQDVMQLLHISVRTLQTLRSNGTLPYSRINNKIYYRRQDIQRILADNYTMYRLRNGYGKNR